VLAGVVDGGGAQPAEEDFGGWRPCAEDVGVGAMSEIAAGLAALERLAGRTPAPASPSQPTLWQDKFDA